MMLIGYANFMMHGVLVMCVQYTSILKTLLYSKVLFWFVLYYAEFGLTETDMKSAVT